MPEIADSTSSDNTAIASCILAAFGPEEGPEIRDLVADLLVDPTARPLISLVGRTDDTVIGHVLYTNAPVEPIGRRVSSALLAPLCVHPAHQGRGLGGRLVRAGLDRLAAEGVELVFVLGHPGYYPKFGFRPAGIRGFEAPYPIAPEHSEAWMVRELVPGIIGTTGGRVGCAAALDDPKYWQE